MKMLSIFMCSTTEKALLYITRKSRIKSRIKTGFLTLGVVIFTLTGTGCATVDATFDKVKTGVSDRLGKNESAKKNALPAAEKNPEPIQVKPDEKPLLVEVQEKLRTLGYYKGPISGKLDSRSEAAIQDFQLDNDLRIDGRPTPTLLQQINKTLGSR